MSSDGGPQPDSDSPNLDDLFADINKHLKERGTVSKNSPPPSEVSETGTLQDARTGLGALYDYVRDRLMTDPATITLDPDSSERRFGGPRATEYRRIIPTEGGMVKIELSQVDPGDNRYLFINRYDIVNPGEEQRMPVQTISIDSNVADRGLFHITERSKTEEGPYQSQDFSCPMPVAGNRISPETISAINRGIQLVNKLLPAPGPLPK